MRKAALTSWAFAGMILATLFSGADADAQFKRIDGCTLTTFTDPCNPDLPGGGPTCLGLPILQDGWTASSRCFGDIPAMEGESYSISVGDEEILFVTKFKLAPLFADTQIVVEDIFIIPSREKCSANPKGEDFALSDRPPMLLLDDVVLAFVSPGPLDGPREYLCGVFLPIAELTGFFGAPPFALDWFACADLDPFGIYYDQPRSVDSDGDGCIDSCVELSAPGKFVAREGIDELGAGLANFLLNRKDHSLTCVDVFEPQGRSFVPPALPGMARGESHFTRPWSFTVVP